MAVVIDRVRVVEDWWLSLDSLFVAENTWQLGRTGVVTRNLVLGRLGAHATHFESWFVCLSVKDSLVEFVWLLFNMLSK